MLLPESDAEYQTNQTQQPKRNERKKNKHQSEDKSSHILAVTSTSKG